MSASPKLKLDTLTPGSPKNREKRVDSEGEESVPQRRINSASPKSSSALPTPEAVKGEEGKDSEKSPGICEVPECNAKVYAAGFCPLHLPTREAALTPTTLNRATYSLWQHHLKTNQTHIQVATWKFVYRGEFHTLMLQHDIQQRCYSVFLDGRPQHTSDKQKRNDDWQLELRLDDLKCVFVCTKTGGKDKFSYQLILNDQSFAEAEQEFLKNLAEKQVAQLRAAPINVSTVAYTPRSAYAHARHNNPAQRPSAYDAAKMNEGYSQYSSHYWQKGVDQGRTKSGFKKSTVTWKFTLQGMLHEVKFAHSLFSNKRKVFLDRKVIIEDKPGAMAGRSGEYSFKVSKTKLTVVMEHKERGEKTGHDKSGQHDYTLLIDGVPFEKCTQSIFDVAAGIAPDLNRNTSTGAAVPAVPVSEGEVRTRGASGSDLAHRGVSTQVLTAEDSSDDEAVTASVN
eukprot:gb/GEZN01007060.1/.p1 GENE.gb/GEZN01007060.1/~~gb/GEZN01007060.1/.p1  ORF type:complete len:453 (-),score=40.10 gb/GEZN01007060.1/:143-1501(-)